MKFYTNNNPPKKNSKLIKLFFLNFLPVSKELKYLNIRVIIKIYNVEKDSNILTKLNNLNSFIVQGTYFLQPY